MSDYPERDQFWATLETLGLAEVRLRLPGYGEAGNRSFLAKAWIAREEDRLRTISQDEANSIARDASNATSRAAAAAERSATAAESANTRATIAVMASITSIIVTITIAVAGLFFVHAAGK